jgi:hypothetical protein
MKKADFDIATDAVSGHDTALDRAQEVLDRNRNQLQTSGVVAMWIGAKASRPYIMLAVNPDQTQELRQVIPDSLDGISVYYIEGIPSLMR